MNSSVQNDLQTPVVVEPDLTVTLSSSRHESAREEEKAHNNGEKDISITEDVVSFSDASKPRTEADPSNKQSSLPVSNSEKKALLGPVRSRRGFSVYG
jgi:hypothetical protein